MNKYIFFTLTTALVFAGLFTSNAFAETSEGSDSSSKQFESNDSRMGTVDKNETSIEELETLPSEIAIAHLRSAYSYTDLQDEANIRIDKQEQSTKDPDLLQSLLEERLDINAGKTDCIFKENGMEVRIEKITIDFTSGQFSREYLNYIELPYENLGFIVLGPKTKLLSIVAPKVKRQDIGDSAMKTTSAGCTIFLAKNESYKKPGSALNALGAKPMHMSDKQVVSE